MRDDLTDINVLLDRSGSTRKITEDIKGGFDTFIEEQKKLRYLSALNATVTLTQFDTEVEVVYEGRALPEVPPLVHVPRSSTALLDAIGTTVVKTGERLKALDEKDRPGKVIFLIITDGLENASREYKRAKIYEMIEHQRAQYQWEFVFLAAGQDAMGEAAKMGIRKAHDFKASGQGVRRVARNMSKGVGSYRSGGGYKHGDS